MDTPQNENISKGGHFLETGNTAVGDNIMTSRGMKTGHTYLWGVRAAVVLTAVIADVAAQLLRQDRRGVVTSKLVHVSASTHEQNDQIPS